MDAWHSRRRLSCLLAALITASSVAFAQGPTSPPATAPPADTTAKPAPPTSPVSGIRNKISAGDLLSAESVLEVYREKNGEDAAYASGMGWLARGALLLGDFDKARRYAADARARAAPVVASGDTSSRAHDFETALGAAIEVDAQLAQRERGAAAAARQVRAELDRLSGPVALRSRLHKRLNLISLAGERAPELEWEDGLGGRPTLAALAGKPVVLFLWAEWCADCRAQATTLARVTARHAADSVRVIALTRFYDEAAKRPIEKARVDSTWRAVYSAVGPAPIVFSTASMERYGGSSTPTFVFVDRKGVVRGYTPTRLTDAEFERALAPILR